MSLKPSIIRLRQCCDHPLIVLMCTMSSTRRKRPSVKELKDDYSRIIRILNIRKEATEKGISNLEASPSTVVGADGDPNTPARGVGTVNLGLTPDRGIAFDLPVLEQLFTPLPQQQKGLGGRTPSVCFICFNGLEVPSL